MPSWKLILIATTVCAFGQMGVPHIRAEDVRPHGSAEPRPLVPGLLTWIFGSELTSPPGCGAKNLMDPSTYQTELCGTRVLVGGIPARLIAVMPGQINLVLPDHPWENEKVGFQVVRDGQASELVPVYFGVNRPVLSLAVPAFAGMPVWVRVEKPWAMGRLRYPFQTEPWDMGGGSFLVRFEGAELPPSLGLPPAMHGLGMTIGLPREVPAQYLNRVPLHLIYPMSRPGTYQVRYTEYRWRPGKAAGKETMQSDWTDIVVLPSTPAQRRAWLQSLAAAPPRDTVELLSNYLPSLLAQRDEAALRLLVRYLDSTDMLVQRYSGYALQYFDAGTLRRVAPGRQPLRGGVR